MKQEQKLMAGGALLLALAVGVYVSGQQAEQDAKAHSGTPSADLPKIEGPLLEISQSEDEGITLTLPDGIDADDQSMILLHSTDLQTWSPVDRPDEDSIEVETEYRQGYYRLAPQP